MHKGEVVAKVYSMEGVVPDIHPEAFVHPEAVIIGDVTVGPNCYIGPCASLRGDFGPIEVGAGSNIQDGCVVHSHPGICVVVEGNCHVGHGAILHGCTIRRNSLIGMNAVVLDRAVVGESAIVGACALVPSNMVVPPATLATGIPAKVVRDLSPEEIERKVEGTLLYQELARRSMISLKKVIADP